MKKLARTLGAVVPAMLIAGAVNMNAALADEFASFRTFFTPLPALAPIPADNSLTLEKIELGKMLFFEPRISGSGVISCASCHNPALGWVDRIPRATGHDGQVGERNTPTVLNSGFLEAQFWDGREPDLEGQALGPIQAEIEMAMSLEDAISRLASFDAYQKHFEAAFPGQANPITAENVAKALATFQRTLNTPNSPFDRYLQGDEHAMTQAQKRGMAAFVNSGCIACHRGVNFSDSRFHRFKVPGATDEGRFVVTGDEADRFTFRTPTLRNVAVTYPYFNNGSVATLEEAVQLMGDQMLGRTLDEATVDDIVAFLHALTGEMPQVGFPALP